MSKVKKVATLSLGQGVNVVVNFLFLPYMARVLDYEDYGSYGQVLLIGSFIAALLSFGLPQIIYVYLSRNERTKTVFTTNIFAAVTLGLIGSLFLFFTSSFFASWLANPAIGEMLQLYSVILICILPNNSINSFLIFKNRVKESVSVTILSNILKVILVVYVIQVYASVFLALLAIVVSSLIQLIAGLYLTRRNLTFSFDSTLFYEQIKKGFPLGLTGILGTGILYIDGLMVSRFEGVNAYAIYRNGAIEVPYIATIYSSIAAIILPEVAKLFANNKFKEISMLKRKVIMNTMALTYPILVFLLFNSEDIIVLYLGEKYEASALIFAIFNLTLLIRVNDYSDILIAANRGRYILFSYAVSFIVNISLNYVLIQSLGLIGAAISTVISISLLAFLQFRASLISIQSKFSEFIHLKQITKLLVISISLALILNVGLDSIFEGLVKLMAFSIIYFSAIYFYLLKFEFFSPELVSRILPQKMRDKL